MSRGPGSASLVRTAETAARSAGAVLMRHFRTKLKVSEKKGAGLVTNADVQAEKAVLRILKRATPGFSVLAEESGTKSGGLPGRWVIDPLDGTTNYVHGFPMFCVSIAAQWEGRTVAAVIYHPPLGDLYSARLGMGARLNGKPIRVSQTRLIRNALLTTGFTYRKDRWLRTEMRAFEKLSREARAIRRPGSAALDLAFTARGVFDGFWERRLSPWDVAAGDLIVREAGGRVTGFDGRIFDVSGGEILAANPALHRKILPFVR